MPLCSPKSGKNILRRDPAGDCRYRIRNGGGRPYGTSFGLRQRVAAGSDLQNQRSAGVLLIEPGTPQIDGAAQFVRQFRQAALYFQSEIQIVLPIGMTIMNWAVSAPFTFVMGRIFVLSVRMMESR